MGIAHQPRKMPNRREIGYAQQIRADARQLGCMRQLLRPRKVDCTCRQASNMELSTAMVQLQQRV